MPLTRRETLTANDTQMLAAAERLFQDFQDVPIITVIRALGAARAELRDADEPVTPLAVEILARVRLEQEKSGSGRKVLAVA